MASLRSVLGKTHGGLALTLSTWINETRQKREQCQSKYWRKFTMFLPHGLISQFQKAHQGNSFYLDDR